MRDSVVFYRSFVEAIEDLPGDDFKQAVMAILAYALDDIEPEVSGAAKTFFKMAKPLIDTNNKKYQNGTKGGRPITKKKPINNQSVTKTKPNYVDVDVDENVNEDVKTSCPEPETAPARIAASFVLNDGSMYNVTENDVAQYQQLYPGIDCMQEIRKIVGWCDANPKNRKTRSGAKRFVNSWLSRAQDSARPAKPTPEPNRFHNFGQRDSDYDAIALQRTRERLEGR